MTTHVVYQDDGRTLCGRLYSKCLKVDEILDWGLTPEQRVNLCEICDKVLDKIIEANSIRSENIH